MYVTTDFECQNDDVISSSAKPNGYQIKEDNKKVKKCDKSNKKKVFF